MVYVEDFDAFSEQAQKLFAENPTKSRFTQKFRGEDNVVVLKVTNDQICIKHKLKGEFRQVQRVRTDLLTRVVWEILVCYLLSSFHEQILVARHVKKLDQLTATLMRLAATK